MIELKTQEAFTARKHRGQVAALAEVLIAFAFTHFTFRALKHFTFMGRIEVLENFTPGLVMTFYTVCLLAICQRSFAVYGLSFTRWSDDLKVGLLWGAVLVGGGAILALLRIRHQPGARPPGMTESLVFAGASLIGIALFVWLLKRQKAVLDRVPTMLCLVLLSAVLLLPVAVALRQHQSGVHAMGMVSWLFFGAGFGEEIFYRGYLQSRLNVAFGRPLCLGGAQFGAGLIITSLLFGFLHTLNSVDYFQGRFTFAWGYGVATFCVGLLYGFLRETTGSVFAPAITHGVLDVMARLSSLLP